MGIFGEVAGVDYDMEDIYKAQEELNKRINQMTNSEKLRMYSGFVVLDGNLKIISGKQGG